MIGYGLCNYKDGNIYEGEFVKNQRNGKGKFIFKNNLKYLLYDGGWINGKMNGDGELTFTNGDRYVG